MMDKLQEEIRELQQRTKQNLRQFLETDLQTCLISIERGELELSLGNGEEARKELGTANHGAHVIERFLRDADSPMPDIQSRLADLRASIAALQENIERASQP